MERRELDVLVLELLRDQCQMQVGDGEVPSSPVKPYAICYPLAAVPFAASMATSVAMLNVQYQVKVIAETQEQARWGGQRVWETLHGGTIPGVTSTLVSAGGMMRTAEATYQSDYTFGLVVDGG